MQEGPAPAAGLAGAAHVMACTRICTHGSHLSFGGASGAGLIGRSGMLAGAHQDWGRHTANFTERPGACAPRACRAVLQEASHAHDAHAAA